MPRKIDYSLKAKSQAVRRDLNRQNAIVDAIRSGEVAKAEILSGTDLVPKDPIYQGLIARQREKENNKQDKILNQLKLIVNKPDFDYNKFSRAFKKMIDLGETEREAITAPLPPSDDEDEVVIEEAEEDAVGYPEALPIPVKIGENDYVTLTLYDKEAIDATTDLDVLKQYLDIGLQDNRAYFDRLNAGKRGQHLIKNQEDHQINYENYTKYLAYIKQRISQVQQGSGIMTNLSDLSERLQLLVGSIEAGNGNKGLKNELADILHYLYKNKKISKAKYKMFMNLTE